MTELPQSFQIVCAFVFGSIIGSFLNVCIYRLPRNQSLVFPPSRCAKCKTRIRIADNVPIMGYFLRRGRCLYCGTPFSIRYPIVELLVACFAAWLVWKYQIGFWSIFYFIFGSSMLVVFFIDIDHRIIPNSISIPGIFAGVLAALIFPMLVADWFVDIRSSVMGALLGGGFLYGINAIYMLLTGRDGIGFGDVKLMAMLGAFFGSHIVLLTIFFSSLIGSIVGFAIVLFAGKSTKYPIPFGPFIITGCVLAIWLGEELTRYVGF